MKYSNFKMLEDSYSNNGNKIANATVDITTGIFFKKTKAIHIFAEKCKYGIVPNLWRCISSGNLMPYEVFDLEKAYLAKESQ